jgi:outer membrane usher protein
MRYLFACFTLLFSLSAFQVSSLYAYDENIPFYYLLSSKPERVPLMLVTAEEVLSKELQKPQTMFLVKPERSILPYYEEKFPAKISLLFQRVLQDDPKRTDPPLYLALSGSGKGIWQRVYITINEMTQRQEKQDFDAAELEAMSKNDIFARAFGKTQKTEPSLSPVKSLIHGRSVGQISALLDQGQEKVSVDASSVMEHLDPLLQDEYSEYLHSDIDEQGRLSLDSLNASGCEAQFDWNSLTLSVEIPAENRKAEQHQLRKHKPFFPKNEIEYPEPVSAFINFHGTQEALYDGDDLETRGRIPNQALIDGAMNLSGYVFEFAAHFRSDIVPELQRDDLRLVKQNPELRTRFALGDQSMITQGFQNSVQNGGVSYGTNDALQPYRTTYPISRYSIFLKNDSRVEIWINGQLNRTLQLRAGEHDIRDFPVTIGSNDIELRLVDSLGQEELIQLPFIHEPRLLEPGYDQYSMHFGFPYRISRGRRDYDMSDPMLSLFYRNGISDSYTLGTYFQGKSKQWLLGLEGGKALPFGFLLFDAAHSYIDKMGFGWGSLVSFQNYLSDERDHFDLGSWRVSAECRARRFGSLGAITPDNDTRVRLTGSWARRMFCDINTRLFGNYQFNRDSKQSYRVGVNMDRRFYRDIDTRLEIVNTGDNKGAKEWNAVINLSWYQTEKHQSWAYQYHHREKKHRGEWRYQSPKQVEAWRAFLSYDNQPASDAYQARVGYQGYRYRANFKHGLINYDDVEKTTQHKSQLQLSSALVFAGGEWALSQPITDSFAIVTPHKHLKDQKIGLNLRNDLYEAKIDGFGPAVKYNLQSYRVQRIQVDAPDLPIGYSLGKKVRWLLPSYRSGFKLIAGTSASVFLGGSLIDQEGNALAFQAGEVSSLDEEDFKPILFFSSGKAEIRVVGLKAGRFRLNLFTMKDAKVDFEIPEDKAGFFDIGVLQLMPILTEKE